MSFHQHCCASREGKIICDGISHELDLVKVLSVLTNSSKETSNNSAIFINVSIGG